MERINRIREMLEASPGDSFLRHALALEYIKHGDEKQAREQFEALLGKDPGYVGSYYHLAKLLEQTGQRELAIEWYEKGMLAARTAGDQHALNELQSAYEDLIY